MCSQSLALLTIREYQLCVVSCKVYQARFPQCLRNCLEEVSKPCLYCNNPEASSTSVGPLPGNSCADPEYVCVCVWGGGGGRVPVPLPHPPSPPERSQNKGFLSNTGPDPPKNHKATKPAFNVGPSSTCQ